jgi:5,10-methylenetetrahydromethanopterin reductase
MNRLDDLGVFLAAGRIKDPRVVLQQGDDAERIGFGTAWMSERYDLKEAGAILGGVAARTRHLRVATGVIAAGSRHPLLTAALAATMHAAYDGRFRLGLGRSASEFLRGQSMDTPGLQAFEDYIEIVRRLLDGETVSYEGPAGCYDGLRVVDRVEGIGRPSIWSAVLGMPRSTRLAARVADGVLLQPFTTPEATARIVTTIRAERERVGFDPAGVRICIPVITACELDEAETLAITKARMVTYVQMPSFARSYCQVNGWDAAPMRAIAQHPMFSAIDRETVDQAFHRDDLLEPAALVPDSWMREAAAIGSVDECITTLREYAATGADEIARYGSSPAQNESLATVWRSAPRTNARVGS